MSLRMAVIYEDDSIMVQMTPGEFVDELKKKMPDVDWDNILGDIIKELKKKTNVI